MALSDEGFAKGADYGVKGVLPACINVAPRINRGL